MTFYMFLFDKIVVLILNNLVVCCNTATTITATNAKQSQQKYGYSIFTSFHLLALQHSVSDNVLATSRFQIYNSMNRVQCL